MEKERKGSDGGDEHRQKPGAARGVAEVKFLSAIDVSGKSGPRDISISRQRDRPDLSSRLQNYPESFGAKYANTLPAERLLISPFYFVSPTTAEIKWIRAAIYGSIDFNALGRPRRGVGPFPTGADTENAVWPGTPV